MKMKNILAVVAHADDLELMAGGSIIKWIKEGKSVHVLTFTDGALTLPDGTIYRSKKDAANEEKKASQYIGYSSYMNIGIANLHLSYSDENVVNVLQCIKQYKIDTLMTHFNKDTHHDHETTARITVAASRRVPNLLMGQSNYFLYDFFTPNIFVDITDTWSEKIKALKIYKSQWRTDWFEFLDATSKYYGKFMGVERAEGFYSPKLKI